MAFPGMNADGHVVRGIPERHSCKQVVKPDDVDGPRDIES